MRCVLPDVCIICGNGDELEAKEFSLAMEFRFLMLSIAGLRLSEDGLVVGLAGCVIDDSSQLVRRGRYSSTRCPWLLDLWRPGPFSTSTTSKKQIGGIGVSINK